MLLQVHHQRQEVKDLELEHIMFFNQINQLMFHNKMIILSEMQMLDSFLRQIQALLLEDGGTAFVVGSPIYGQAVDVS
jgi:hypothetical protein